MGTAPKICNPSSTARQCSGPVFLSNLWKRKHPEALHCVYVGRLQFSAVMSGFGWAGGPPEAAGGSPGYLKRKSLRWGPACEEALSWCTPLIA